MNHLHQKLEITSAVGIGPIWLGCSPQDALGQLTNLGAEHNYHAPSHVIYCETIQGELQFTAGNSSRLFQVAVAEKELLVNGERVIGLRLDKALEILKVTTLSEGLWSAVDVDSEFADGVQIPDSKRLRKCNRESLLQTGTLWIKSLGLGLVLNLMQVQEVLLRMPEDVPRVGCGELTQADLDAIKNHNPFAAYVSPPVEASAASWLPRLSAAKSLLTRVVLCAAAIALVAVPIGVVVTDIHSWQNANAVTGKVIQTLPPGPFPDFVIVEYVSADGETRKTKISTNYATAREVGEEVELLYRSDKPGHAMTRIQSRDEGLSVSPYLLFGSFALATFLLAWAFPEWISLKKRRMGN